MSKYYFGDALAEVCYSLDVHLDTMEMEGWDEMEIYEAIREVGVSHFWCKQYGVAEKDEFTCGGHCKFYKPRNGISGICTEWAYCYVKGNKLILKKDGSLINTNNK